MLNVKWLRRLHVVSEPVMARNETAKYTELLPSGKTRQFTFIMEAKSLITSPTFGHKLDKPGLYQISGLAWSGRGKIRQVQVSTDGENLGESRVTKAVRLMKPVTYNLNAKNCRNNAAGTVTFITTQ